jgi:hypothetical protein
MDFNLLDSQHHRRGRNAQGRVEYLQGAPTPRMEPTIFSGILCISDTGRKGFLFTGPTATVAGYNAQEGLLYCKERTGPKDGAFFLGPHRQTVHESSPDHKFCGEMLWTEKGRQWDQGALRTPRQIKCRLLTTPDNQTGTDPGLSQRPVQRPARQVTAG